MADKMPTQTFLQESLRNLQDSTAALQKGMAAPESRGGPTQLAHTPNNSLPGTHAGTSVENVEGEDDGIDETGENYMSKSLQDVQASLVRKADRVGLTTAEIRLLQNVDPAPILIDRMQKAVTAGKQTSFTKAERWVLNAMQKGSAPPFAKKDDDDEDEKKKKGEKMEKGGAAAVSGYTPPPAHQVVDASIYLDSMQKSIQAGMGVVQGEVVSMRAEVATLRQENASLRQHIEQRDAARTRYEGALSKAVQDAAEQLAAMSSVINEIATGPATAPRSQFALLQGGISSGGITEMSKGLQPGDAPSWYQGPLRKSVAVDILPEMVRQRQINQAVVERFEHNQRLEPAIEAKVTAALSAAGR